MSTHKEISSVEVYAGNIVEAGMVQSLLESADIKAFLRDEIMGTFYPWYVAPGGSGSVRIFVSSDDAEAARAIVEDYERNTQPE